MVGFEHLDEGGVISLPDTPNCGIQSYKIDDSKHSEGRLKIDLYDYIAYQLTEN